LHFDQIQPVATGGKVPVLTLPSRLGETYFSHLLRLGDRLIPVLDLFALGIVNSPTKAVQASREMAFPARTGHTPGRLILFSLGDDAVGHRPRMAGLLESQVMEVLDEGEISPIPGSRPEVHGVRLWRDAAVAVLDLTCFVGSASADETRKKCLICFHPALGEPAGLLIPGRCRSVTLPLVHLASQGTVMASSPHFHSVVETDFALIGLLDPASLI